MKQHEREFFISLIRSGKIIVKSDKVILEIRPLTFDQILESCQIFNEAFEKAYIDEMMDEEQMHQWMIEHGIWNEEDDEKIQGLRKDIDRLKVEIYNARYNDALKDKIRLYIRAGEKQLSEQLNKKHLYYQNTCEGYATNEKIQWVLKNTTYIKNTDVLYDFSDFSIVYLIDEFQNQTITENKIRELARSDPWRSLWIIHEKGQLKLFNNPPNTDLTYNQKNLVVWSQMYDNINESIDCPSKEVIEDDDMLDGWFILQSKKRETQNAEQEFNKSVKSDKIKNASEVFVMAGNKTQKNRIESMNDINAQNIKKQREALIKSQGSVTQDKFQDEKMKIGNMRAEMYKGRFK